MTDQAIINLALIVLSASLGLNIAFWCAIGLLRFIAERFVSHHPQPSTRLRVADVAAVIPAYNEEVALPKCIRALTKIMPASQIYVASDGSKDRTVAIARWLGCQVLDIQPNRGKAQALALAIKEHRLCDAYEAVLIHDADSEIDPHYLDHALPLFDDPEVVVVAGHVLSRWQNQRCPSRGMLFTAYRTRLYRIVQAVFQFGQSWKWTSVSYIAPGVASIYRTSALKRINIAAPGLVIEDFNMTFEVQHKRLGRIAYSPRARCLTEDPFRLTDYRKQVSRWYLGFWQTVWRHGVWCGKFWAALGPILIELLIFCAFSLILPVMAVLQLAFGIDSLAFSLSDLSIRPVSPLYLLALFLSFDYALTMLVAVIDRRFAMLVYGIAFPALRLLDAALFLGALLRSFSYRSEGRWISPQRRREASVGSEQRL
ncbi:MAG: glycosyltransferase family 2 protein [Hyphomicrobiales bacterium]|nr:glycosyltransferase family 2 protein [Hyphomicrobiales bacterium]